MRFRLFAFASFFVTQATASEQSPIGVTIRPAFFKALIESSNQFKRPVAFQTCLQEQDIFVSGTFSFKLASPSWVSSKEHLFLRSTLETYDLSGRIQLGCAQPKKRYQYEAHLKNYPLQFALSPQGMILIDPNSEGAFHFQPSMTLIDEDTGASLPNVVNFLQKREVQAYLWGELRSFLTRELSALVIDRWRSLVFVQPISDLLNELPSWRTGTIVQKDGLTIEFDGPPLTRKDSIFFSTPFHTASKSAFIGPNSLEIYFQAGFLTSERIESAGLGDLFLRELSDSDFLSLLKNRLSTETAWPVPKFSLPPPIATLAQLTLSLPTSLINEALRVIYRQGLLKFKTAIHLGKQAQGVISPEAPEVRTVIGVRPRSAPEIKFSTTRPRVEIRDYELQVNTEIEDRLIPSTQFSISASVAAQLHLAQATQTVNLLLDPDSFTLSIDDRAKPLSINQKDLFARIARGLWTEFLNQSADLILFPSLLNTKDQPIRLEVVGLDLTEKHVYLHLNFEWKETP